MEKRVERELSVWKGSSERGSWESRELEESVEFGEGVGEWGEEGGGKTC